MLPSIYIDLLFTPVVLQAIASPRGNSPNLNNIFVQSAPCSKKHLTESVFPAALVLIEDVEAPTSAHCASSSRFAHKVSLIDAP